MIIRYNSGQNRFEAQFSSDFQGDLSAVKAAGFKTDGPPSWTWWAVKVPVLNKLRENKPASGLEITEEAYAVYAPMAERYTKNLEVKKQAAELVKKAKKEQKLTDSGIPPCCTEDGQWLPLPEGYLEGLPKPPEVSRLSNIQKLTGPTCLSCGDVVAFYEQQNPPLCLWCEIHRKSA